MKIKFRELKNSLFTEENIKIGTKVFKVAALMYFCRRIPVFAQDENQTKTKFSLLKLVYNPNIQNPTSLKIYSRTARVISSGISISLLTIANTPYANDFKIKKPLLFGATVSSLVSCIASSFED